MSNAVLHPETNGSEQSDSMRTGRSPSFRLTRGEWAVFIAVLIFYAVTRLWGITDFPIYFFCDEAHQANLAQDLVANSFHDEDGIFCPAYFRNVRVFNLGLSVWIQALPVTTFGKTIFTVRATSATVGLASTTVAMTRDALVNGPLWFRDYGMHGLQWGSKELFGELNRYLVTAPPGSRIAISHLWANNTNALGEFFLDPDDLQRVDWIVMDDILRERIVEVQPTTVFVLTPHEFEQARESPKVQIEDDFIVIPDPAGQPGFYLVRLAYTAEADALFAADRDERRQLTDTTLTIDGASVRVRYPKLDMGVIGDAFDGNLRSLARTLDGNPTDLFLSFSQPRPVTGVRLHLWTDHYNVDLRATRSDGEVVQTRAEHVTGRPPEAFEVRFDDVIPDIVQLDLHISKRGDEHIHMREIEILD